MGSGFDKKAGQIRRSARQYKYNPTRWIRAMDASSEEATRRSHPMRTRFSQAGSVPRLDQAIHLYNIIGY